MRSITSLLSSTPPPHDHAQYGGRRPGYSRPKRLNASQTGPCCPRRNDRFSGLRVFCHAFVPIYRREHVGLLGYSYYTNEVIQCGCRRNRSISTQRNWLKNKPPLQTRNNNNSSREDGAFGGLFLSDRFRKSLTQQEGLVTINRRA